MHIRKAKWVVCTADLVGQGHLTTTLTVPISVSKCTITMNFAAYVFRVDKFNEINNLDLCQRAPMTS